MKVETTFEEKKRRYIESVEQEQVPPEVSMWQYPPPTYHHTKDYATKFPQTIHAGESVVFKRPGNNFLIAIVIMTVAGVLLYLLARKSFGFNQLILLTILLLVILPFLLDNKPAIVISRESIWVAKDDTNVPWKDILFIYIKEVHQEHTEYFFIVHYYDEEKNEFNKVESPLHNIVSPSVLAATIEEFQKKFSANKKPL